MIAGTGLLVVRTSNSLYLIEVPGLDRVHEILRQLPAQFLHLGALHIIRDRSEPREHTNDVAIHYSCVYVASNRSNCTSSVRTNPRYLQQLLNHERHLSVMVLTNILRTKLKHL